MRWSSHSAKGCVPAEPMRRPFSAAMSRTWRRRLPSWRAHSPMSRHGSVAISRTDSMSSGLMKPSVASASSDSIALTRSSVSASTIMSSSSTPTVKSGPVNRCSMARGEYPCHPGENGWGSDREEQRMSLGYDGRLYILAFDHRGSFQKKMFGIEGDPSPEQTDTIADAKHLIFEGMVKAADRGVDAEAVCVLVDEQLGAPRGVPAEAKERGLKLAMPAEKSGQDMFDFEYGDQFGEHILEFDPDFTKVLVRYNPEGDAAANRDQAGKLKRLSDWLHDNGRKFLFELLVPAEDPPLESVGGDTDRYDAELRPELMRGAITELQDAGVEPDIWKIEGVDERSDAEMLVEATRRDGRDGVVSVLLGRGASDAKVDHWLEQAATVHGVVGFAIGRSIWWDALKGFLDGSLDRDTATDQVADNYLRFIKVYEQAEQGSRVG